MLVTRRGSRLGAVFSRRVASCDTASVIQLSCQGAPCLVVGSSLLPSPGAPDFMPNNATAYPLYVHQACIVLRPTGHMWRPVLSRLSQAHQGRRTAPIYAAAMLRAPLQPNP